MVRLIAFVIYLESRRK